MKYYLDTIKTTDAERVEGTTQDNFSLDKLLTFDFIVPDAPTQAKIASILSAYDDLIENNTRRIAILEEMAQAIYREWFVEFRFPGHEKRQTREFAAWKDSRGVETHTLGRSCRGSQARRRSVAGRS